MKILDPQSAVLTNAEVLAHFTLNPPRRSPAAPPNANPRIFVPSPDLRDHNTVVKEFQDYVSRIAPHLMRYPSFYPKSTTSTAGPQTNNNGEADASNDTPLDIALRELITRLKPYQLTKAEVLAMVNLGIGLVSVGQPQDVEDAGEGEEGGVDVDGTGDDTVMQDAEAEANGAAEVEVETEGQAEDGEGEAGEEDYGAMAILNTVIEDRIERLTDEDIVDILVILKESLGGKKSGVETVADVDGVPES